MLTLQYLQHDIRYGLRVLLRTPVLTAIALLSIAISVGATAVVFTAIKAVLIEPLPYSKPADLVQIRTEYSKFGRSRADWVSWSDMQDVIRNNHTLESLGTYRYAILNLAGDQNAPPEALYGLGVSASLFPALGVKPMLGRNFLPEEDQPGRDRELILSYDLWQRRFNSDRGIVGKSVQIDDYHHVIVGVMPPEFDFPLRLATTGRMPYRHMQFWAPLGVDPAKAARAATGFGAVARLRKGVSQVQAEQDLEAVGSALEREFPASNEGRSLHLAGLGTETIGTAQTGLLLLMGAAVMLMLIGCSNVANLLLARALGRHREIAVRLALGAGRVRIIRQLMTESCVLAVAGGISAYALAVLAWTVLRAIAPMTIPRLAAARADWTVFAFTLAISLLNGILFGIAPALRTARRDPSIALAESATRSTGGSRNRLRSVLVIAEVAVALTLLVVGGLLTGSFVRLLRTDPGFQADRVLASIIVPTGERYKNAESRSLLLRRVLDSVRALPGVESVGAVDALPFSGENTGGLIRTNDSSADQAAEIDHVTTDYLPTMGVPLLQGRWFLEAEATDSRDAAIVNDIAASRLWPGENAVGQRICVNCAGNRTQEIGIRVALGATPHHVHTLIFRQGMLMAGAGVAIGLAGTVALMRVLRGVLGELAGHDPLLAGSAVLLVIGAAAIACWIPARRATRIDPMAALRE